MKKGETVKKDKPFSKLKIDPDNEKILVGPVNQKKLDGFSGLKKELEAKTTEVLQLKLKIMELTEIIAKYKVINNSQALREKQRAWVRWKVGAKNG